MSLRRKSNPEQDRNALLGSQGGGSSVGEAPPGVVEGVPGARRR